jgi:hypothetical protein
MNLITVILKWVLKSSIRDAPKIFFLLFLKWGINVDVFVMYNMTFEVCMYTPMTKYT